METPGRGHAGDRLSALLDDELDDDSAVQVTRHLARCDACMAELEQLRRTRAALRGLGAPSPSLGWMVETVVLTPAELAHPAPSGPSRAPAVLGVLLLGVVVLSFALGGGGVGSTVPSVERFVVDHVTQVEGGPVVTPARLDAPVGP